MLKVILLIAPRSRRINGLPIRRRGRPLQKKTKMIIQDCPYLLFKTSKIKMQWISGQIDSALQIIILFAAKVHFRFTGKPQMLTSLMRDEIIYPGDSGIHMTRPCRAGDLCTKELERLSALPETAGIMATWELMINSNFPYLGKPGAKTCKIHDIGEGLHAHIQRGPNEKVPFEEVKNG